MAALLGSKAIIGFEEFNRLAVEQSGVVRNTKKEVIADLINAASVAIESYCQMPIIYTQYTEYYYGPGFDVEGWRGDAPRGTAQGWSSNRYLSLEKYPVVIDGSHTFTLKVRETGDELLHTAAGWTTWTKDTDYLVNTDKGVLTVNPVKHPSWPSGFRNIYVDYWAGRGEQTLDDDSEVITSTCPADLRLACAKLVEFWFKASVIEYGTAYVDESGMRPPTAMTIPESVKELIHPYKMRRGINWSLV